MAHVLELQAMNENARNGSGRAADVESIAQALHWQAVERFRRTGDKRRLFDDWEDIARRFPGSVWALRMRLGGPTARAS